MNDFKIVEYRAEYAASMAKMWNMSAENWGGYDTVFTAEDVIEENRNSGNINTYLALDGNEVIGICSLSRFREDEGALYIPLLNVRPDYHGKKVGKALVLQVVNRVVELGWPRLDLHTWPGNTKAVPLYKKCGFFWEKRDDRTHLMNFIPSVLRLEPVSEYFKEMDWYQDSRRPIEIVPDGAEENDYCFYEYLWEKEGRKLRIQYERRARGLRLIETDDYLIRAVVDGNELVSGFSYQVRYDVVNKSGRELNVSVQGLDNRNISFNYQETARVRDKLTLTGEFLLGEIEEEQNRWKTHPAVTAEILVNGKKALFQVGIRPRYPVKLTLSVPERELFLENEDRCHLNLENGFNEEIGVELEFPDTGMISFRDGRQKLVLGPEEKRSIPVGFVLHGYHHYSEIINLRIRIGGGRYSFKKRLTAPFRGRGASFGGEGEKEWILCSGEYLLTLNKDNNEIKVRNYSPFRGKVLIMFPRLGRRGSLEFAGRRPERVSFSGDKNPVLKADYHSEELKGVVFRSVISLSADGLVENYYEVINQSGGEVRQDIWVGQPIFFDFIEAVLPLEGEYIQSPGSEAGEMENWDISRLSENWLFSRDAGSTRGVAWPSEAELASHEWYFSVDNRLEGLVRGEKKTTGPVVIAWETYRDWRDFRTFVLRQPASSPLLPPVQRPIQSREKIALSINDGNPFVNGDFLVGLKQYKKSILKGRIEVSSEKGIAAGRSESLSGKGSGENPRERTVAVPLDPERKAPGVDILTVGLDIDSLMTERKRAFFITGKAEPRGEVSVEKGLEVYRFSNGPLEIRVSPAFSAALSSLRYHGREWLDSSFPAAGPRSWWNPWTGGIISRAEGMSSISLKEGDREAGFCEAADNRGNLWQGLRVDHTFAGNQDFKGLELRQYYMMLPGLPLLLTAGVVVQKTGTHYERQKFITEIFLKPAEELCNCWFESASPGKAPVRYRAGRVAYDILAEKSLLYGADGCKLGIQIYQAGMDPVIGLTNLQVNGCFVTNILSLADGGEAVLPPTFLFFTEKYLEERLLRDLDNIRLEIEC